MTEETRCPNCGAGLVIDAGQRGQEMHCAYCGTPFKVPASAGEKPVVTAPTPSGWPTFPTNLDSPAPEPAATEPVPAELEPIETAPVPAEPEPPALPPEPAEPEPAVLPPVEPGSPGKSLADFAAEEPKDRYELDTPEPDIQPAPEPEPLVEPEPEPPPQPEPEEPVQAEIDSSSDMVPCPVCKRGIWVLKESRGKQVQCPHCGLVVGIPPVAGGAAPPPLPGPRVHVPAPHEPAPHVPDYLAGAILVTILFFCCLPIGILAIMSAVEANQLRAAGKYVAALEAARRAKSWMVTVVVGGGLFILLWYALSH